MSLFRRKRAERPEAGDDLREILSGVSIRGRMAYAIACIRALASARLVSSRSLELCLEYLAEFCAADDVGWWEASAQHRIWPILETRAVVQETGLDVLHELVALAFDDVGRGNLYAAVVGPSEATLAGVLKIAEAVAVEGVPQPDLEPFATLSFAAHGGWGEAFTAIA